MPYFTVFLRCCFYMDIVLHESARRNTGWHSVLQACVWLCVTTSHCVALTEQKARASALHRLPVAHQRQDNKVHYLCPKAPNRSFYHQPILMYGGAKKLKTPGLANKSAWLHVALYCCV